MRMVGLFGAVVWILTAGLLLTAPAGAQPPSKLTNHVTDNAGVLTDSDRAAVSSAIDRLARDRHLQLWVVYVDNFNRFKPDNWADQTRSASKMGGRDVLLAVATNTKLYTFNVPPTVQGLTEAELNDLRGNHIEPAVNAKDWSGAAVAAADGLDKQASSSESIWPLVVFGVIVAVVVVVAVILVVYRLRRRRRNGSNNQVSIDGRDTSSGQALSTADARVRQVSDYVARHHGGIGSDALARFDEAKRYLAAAHGTQATNQDDAIAYANRASTLAAQAQTLANYDVLGAHRPRRRRGTASSR